MDGTKFMLQIGPEPGAAQKQIRASLTYPEILLSLECGGFITSDASDC